MTQVLDAVSLQAIDSELASLRTTLADVEHRLEGDEELTAGREALATAKENLAARRKTQRKLEADIQDLNARIAKEEARLYDGSIKSPKELTNLQREVDGFKATRSGLEDQLLEVLSQVEVCQAQHQELAKSARQLEARWLAHSAALREEAARLQSAITGLEARRDGQAAQLTPVNLRLYESLRQRKGGTAVVRLTGALCGGCRVAIPDGLRRGVAAAPNLVQCPNCERILALG
jgi:hypothetical protein